MGANLKFFMAVPLGHIVSNNCKQFDIVASFVLPLLVPSIQIIIIDQEKLHCVQLVIYIVFRPGLLKLVSESGNRNVPYKLWDKTKRGSGKPTMPSATEA